MEPCARDLWLTSLLASVPVATFTRIFSRYSFTLLQAVSSLSPLTKVGE